jgi:hypothetical protein
MNNYQNLTWDDIKAMYAETAQLMKENEQKLMKMFAESKQQTKETERQMKENSAKVDERLDQLFKRMEESSANADERSAKADERSDRADERLDKLGKYLGGIANSNGEMAEDFFFNTFRRDKIFLNETFDTIRKDYLYSTTGGYHGPESDIVLFNGKSVAIIEVKYNAKPDNIDVNDLISNVALFREYSPAYKNHNVYLGVAAMSFKKGLATKLHKEGIATIHPLGKRIIIYDKNVKAF